MNENKSDNDNDGAERRKNNDAAEPSAEPSTATNTLGSSCGETQCGDPHAQCGATRKET